MDNPNRFTDDDRAAILKCLGEEQALKQQGKPYRESVIVACEIILRLHPVEPIWTEAMTRQNEQAYKNAVNQQQANVPDYWWMRD